MSETPSVASEQRRVRVTAARKRRLGAGRVGVVTSEWGDRSSAVISRSVATSHRSNTAVVT